MFSTLRMNKYTQNVELAPRSVQKACVNCRTRKLRCMGGKYCDRCRSKNISCVYSRSPPRKGRIQSEATRNESGYTVQHQLIAQFTTAPALDDTEFNFSAILGGTGPLEEFSKNGVPADENGNMLNSQITKSGNMFVGGDQLDDITSAMESEEGEPEQHEARADNRVSSVALELEEIQNIDTAVSEANIFCLSPYSLQLPRDGYSPTANQAYDFTTLDPGCQCLSVVSRLLESLSIEEAKACSESVTRLLHLQKMTLNQCGSLLSCFSCCSLSHFVFLLIILCQKMASCFNRIYDMLLSQYLRLQEQINVADENSRNASSEIVALEQVSVKYYELDGHEAPCVIGVLTVLQLKKLEELLSRLRRLARGSNWDSHLAVMAGIEGEIKRQLRLYNRNCDAMYPVEEED